MLEGDKQSRQVQRNVQADPKDVLPIDFLQESIDSHKNTGLGSDVCLPLEEKAVKHLLFLQNHCLSSFSVCRMTRSWSRQS